MNGRSQTRFKQDLASTPQIRLGDDTDLLYVANQGDNDVSVIDASTNTVIATTPNVATGPPTTGNVYGLLGVTLDQRRNLVYTSNSANSQVTVISSA